MDRSRELRVARWKVNIGWAATAAMTLARTITVFTLLIGRPADSLLFAQALFKMCLLVALTVFYRKSAWPSFILIAVWPIGFVFAWTVGKASAPVLIVGFVLGIALYLGASGTLRLRALTSDVRQALTGGSI